MNVAILGSGFGLYGYLPALHALSANIALPMRYRETIERRPELSVLAGSITFVADDHEAIDFAEAVIVARRPADQLDLISGLLARPKLHRLLLEKPLAPTPTDAAQLQERIDASGKIVRMGYLFGYTDWGQRLMEGTSEVQGDLQIRWQFHAHHYATNRQGWKRTEAEGGGALRFYGIQLVSVLASLGFDRVVTSRLGTGRPGEAERWHAIMVNPAGARCMVDVETRAPQALFAINAPSRGVDISRQDPFDVATTDQDRRVPSLVALCREFLAAENNAPASDRRVIALWQAIENVTIRESTF